MTARAYSSFSGVMHKHLPSAWGRHKHPFPRCSRRCMEQRSPATQAGQDSKGAQHPPGSLTQPLLEASSMSPLTFNSLWMGPRIRALIKIGGQDYDRIKTSLIQMPLALCHSHAHGFHAQGKTSKAATQMGSHRAPHHRHAHAGAWQHGSA